MGIRRVVQEHRSRGEEERAAEVEDLEQSREEDEDVPGDYCHFKLFSNSTNSEINRSVFDCHFNCLLSL